MFLHLLNDEQKRAFLILSQRVSMADGEDDFDEIDALEDVKKRMNIDAAPEMNEVLGELPLAPFQTPKARAIVMMELLAVVYADGFLHEAEAALIGEIAGNFGFDQSQLNTMAEWAMDSLDLRRGAEQLLDGL